MSLFKTINFKTTFLTILVVSFVLFLAVRSYIIPNREIFSTKFYTSNNVEKKLSVNELGFFFETKTYQLQFTTETPDCFIYIEIPKQVGQIFATDYKEGTDLNQMFEFQKDKVILYHSLFSKEITEEQITRKKNFEPYLTIPERFYDDFCR